ncbi:hypothetical protein niasHT_032760 [Heterodera trifolii]|uniref:Uncharacterized protein n=1 Tax=Heterodera trifolii TaxID=157864 RepID=A0ABD2IE10_9BILA
MRLSLDTIREFVKLFVSFCQEPLIPLSSYREFLKAAFESDEAQLNSSIEELSMPHRDTLPNEFIGRIGGGNFFRRTSIEVMAPPKNEKIYGPSASVAIFTAFMALATGVQGPRKDDSDWRSVVQHDRWRNRRPSPKSDCSDQSEQADNCAFCRECEAVQEVGQKAARQFDGTLCG